MIYLTYILYAIISIVGTVLSYIVTPAACLALDADGNLTYLRSWLQTPDNPAIGDPVFWPTAHPGYSRYQLAVSWLWRNPSQGLDQALSAKVTMQTPCVVTGDIASGNYLIETQAGYFHKSYRWGIFTGGFGWRLNNIVEGYEHPTMGQLVTTIVRVHK